MKVPATLLIIFGITGDLARRKLLPALSEICASNELAGSLKIIGISRRAVIVEDLLRRAHIDDRQDQLLRSRLEMYTMDTETVEAYQQLDTYLRQQEAALEGPVQRLLYLSVPPLAALPIIESLGAAGMADVPQTKLLLEKPFGTDYQTAKDMVSHIRQYFAEDQIYRIDHYMAKEMAQNIAVFRGGNSLFKSTWNNQFIESVEITACEDIGIEGRAAFYEQTGALRDIAQSHLLQLAALVLMPFATETNEAPIPERRLRALQSMQLSPDRKLDEIVWRGQYKGYRQEVNNESSDTETALSIVLESSDPRWHGVPITIFTGKAMAHKSTEIRIRYRRESADESNQLVMRINPSEAIEVYLWAKKPGYTHKLEKVALSYTYADYYDKLPEPYEQVIVDAIRSERALFTSSDEILEAWRIVEPIIAHWRHGGEPTSYEPGSTIVQATAGLFTGYDDDFVVA